MSTLSPDVVSENETIKRWRAIKRKTLVLKPVGSACNASCWYCFQSNSPRCSGRLSTEHLLPLLDACAASESVNVVLHGGEPLLYGADETRRLLDILHQRLPTPYFVQIQTNGILLDAQWLQLLTGVTTRCALSISLDPEGEKDCRFTDIRDRRLVMHNIADAVRHLGGVGVISVVHKFNSGHITSFIKQLISVGVRYLTLNKIRCESAHPLWISEIEYVRCLEAVLGFWIQNDHYKKIDIQPFLSLLSDRSRDMCIFNPNPEKCHSILTVHPHGLSMCEHFQMQPRQERCDSCEIRDWCGGGCAGMVTGDDFCKARKQLYALVKRMGL